MPRIPVVNEKDEVICYKERADLLATDMNRDAALWVMDENGSILLAKRASSKRVHPDLWTVAVAGTVEEGETYESNIIKEAEEEMGLKNIKPTFLYKYMKTKDLPRMSGIFALTIPRDTPLVADPIEVAAFGWYTKNEIEKLILEQPEIFTPNFATGYKKFIDSYDNK